MGLIKRGNLVEKGILVLKEQAPRFEISNSSLDISSAELPELPELPAGEGTDNESVLAYAKNEAQDIMRRAMEEAEEIKAHAQEAGLDEARRMAEETASDKVKDAISMLNQAVIERKKIVKDAESEILRLALKVAEQIIRSEVSLHRDVSLNIVSDAISRVSDREQVIIRVNKEDIEHIKKYKDRIGNIVDGIKSLSIVEDPGVDAGGCIIETNLGYVDARISTKIAAIDEAFRKAK
jgi:flagellar assembly protein FliH